MALTVVACNGPTSTPTTVADSSPTTIPETTTTTSRAGEERSDIRGVAQVLVPAGCFTMGATESQAEFAQELDGPDWAKRRITTEQPSRQVCITSDYWIDQFEVTNAAFQAFIDGGGYQDQSNWSTDGLNWLLNQEEGSVPVECDGEPDEPRVCVTWYEAEAYATWRGGRLPTEAEWEYAARGPESLIFPWGNEWDSERANVVESDRLLTVGSLPTGVSWVGAHDMAGNAMEWVSDWLSTGYNGVMDQTENPTGAASGRIKVEKGGWWGSNPVVARSTYRHFEDPPSYQDGHIGFRVVTPNS